MALTLSQQSAIVAAERKVGYISKPLYATCQALVRKRYATWHGHGGSIKLTDAGLRFARTGRQIGDVQKPNWQLPGT